MREEFGEMIRAFPGTKYREKQDSELFLLLRFLLFFTAFALVSHKSLSFLISLRTRYHKNGKTLRKLCGS